MIFANVRRTSGRRRWRISTFDGPFTVLSVDDEAHDEAERAGTHQDVADLDEIDFVDVVSDCEGQDCADCQERDGSTDEHRSAFRRGHFERTPNPSIRIF